MKYPNSISGEPQLCQALLEAERFPFTQLILRHKSRKPIMTTAVAVAGVNRCEADDVCLVDAKELRYADTNGAARCSECSCWFMLAGTMEFVSSDLLKHVDPDWQGSNAMIIQF